MLNKLKCWFRGHYYVNMHIKGSFNYNEYGELEPEYKYYCVNCKRFMVAIPLATRYKLATKVTCHE